MSGPASIQNSSFADCAAFSDGLWSKDEVGFRFSAPTPNVDHGKENKPNVFFVQLRGGGLFVRINATYNLSVTNIQVTNCFLSCSGRKSQSKVKFLAVLFSLYGTRRKCCSFAAIGNPSVSTSLCPASSFSLSMCLREIRRTPISCCFSPFLSFSLPPS